VNGEDRLIVRDLLKYFDIKTGKTYVVQPGFYTDGSSIPRLLWPIIGHPFSKYLRTPGTLHDKFYFTGEVSRAEADRMFRQAIQDEGGDKTLAFSCWFGVRIGAWYMWHKYRKLQEKRVKAAIESSS
jgi:hypothetical protein